MSKHSEQAPMPLSQAIRLGAMIRPQAFGEWFFSGGSCAEAAAAEATGFPYQERCSDGPRIHLRQVWPELANLKVSCPIGHCNNGATARATDGLAHLNDEHHLTREQIADIVEQWEQRIEQAQSSALAPRSAEKEKEELMAMVNK